MAQNNTKIPHNIDNCDFCDVVRQFYDLIKKCLKEDNKVEIDVARSVKVDPVYGKEPK
jgi:hypothetical protein